MNQRVSISTFGCKVNSYDTGLLQQRLLEAGWTLAEDGASIHILNSCAVTAEASREALRVARRLKRRDPHCKVVITGCAAQVDTGMFEPSDSVDLIIANSHKGDLPRLLKDSFVVGGDVARVHKSNIFKKDDLEGGGGVEERHTRSFLKIQDGCDSFCTFCVIPFARGKSRSLSIDELVERIRHLEAGGVREVVLTGVHIGDYRDLFFGVDHARGLEDLIGQILVRTKVPRIRLSSLEPVELTDRLIELYQDSRLCRHFHMSIQSAQSRVLSAMKRQYGHVEVESALDAIEARVGESFVGMDVIAGFPSETDAEHRETVRRLAGLPWTKIHVFPYSERAGTYACRLQPKVPPAEITARAQELRELSHERYHRRAADLVGREREVLVLNSRSTAGTGLSSDNWTVRVSDHPGGGSPTPGALARVRVTGYDPAPRSRGEGYLFGEWLDA